MLPQSIWDGITDQNKWSHSSRKWQLQKTKTTTINHSNDDKATLGWKKYTKVCYCKVILMECAIKTSGHNHPGSENDKKTHSNGDKVPLRWEK